MKFIYINMTHLISHTIVACVLSHKIKIIAHLSQRKILSTVFAALEFILFLI